MPCSVLKNKCIGKHFVWPEAECQLNLLVWCLEHLPKGIGKEVSIF